MRVPTRPVNTLGTVGVVVALIGLLTSKVPEFGIVLGGLGVVASALGIAFAVKHDTGMGRSVTGLALALLAVIVSVFVLGMRRADDRAAGPGLRPFVTAAPRAERRTVPSDRGHVLDRYPDQPQYASAVRIWVQDMIAGKA